MLQLGIDISKAKFDVCLYVDGKSKFKVFTNDSSGFNGLMQWLKGKPLDEIHACMEGTGRLWEPLAEFLNEVGFKVSVVNPLKIKGFAQSELRRSKTDKIDAQTIARFCALQCPAVWIPPSPARKEIRDLQRCLDAFKDMQTQEKNRLKSGVLNDRVVSEIKDHLAYMNSRIKSLEKQILALLNVNEEFKRKYDLLRTIKGVGQNTAATFLTELDADNFSTARELEVYCGIAPRIRESGSSVRSRSRISKVGNRIVRRALYMPSLAAMRFNPSLRIFAERLKSNGKKEKL